MRDTYRMHPYRDSKLVKIFLVVFFVLIAIYAFFEAQGILFGPTIEVTNAVSEVSSPYVDITGTTSHIAALSVNGQSVPVTEAGAFDIPFALSPGYNRVVLDANDKYGHSTQKVLQIVYTPSATSSTATSTSTISSQNSTSTVSSTSTATTTLK